jgi:hypothetical protein
MNPNVLTKRGQHNVGWKMRRQACLCTTTPGIVAGPKNPQREQFRKPWPMIHPLLLLLLLLVLLLLLLFSSLSP